MADLTHLGSRVAGAGEQDGARFDGWGGAAVPAHVRAMHQHWAGEYARLLAEGDTGGAFSLLHRLRHSEPAADPWRLLELVARRAMAVSAPDAGNGVNVSLQPGEGTAAAGSEGGERASCPPFPRVDPPAPDPAPGADPSEGSNP